MLINFKTNQWRIGKEQKKRKEERKKARKTCSWCNGDRDDGENKNASAGMVVVMEMVVDCKWIDRIDCYNASNWGNW